MSAHVMIIVTHLLGTGHLMRSVLLARAFQEAGHVPMVVSGGRSVPHLNFQDLKIHQLPPLHVENADFSRMIDSKSQIASRPYLKEREKELLAVFSTFSPDVLITELFPFGRRGLKEEFETILEAATSTGPRPKIFASIRDILAPPSKPKKAIYARDIIQSYFDGVFVHSDPSIITLEESWPVDDSLSEKLIYTGFIAPEPTKDYLKRGNEIIVSAGGGEVGRRLFEKVLEAAKIGSEFTWRFLIGGSDPSEQIKELSRNSPSNVIFEPTRSDFRHLLQKAKASISMCGYNTAMDVLQTKTPAIFVPYSEGNEIEQSLRARALSNLPGISSIPIERAGPSVIIDLLNTVCLEPRLSLDELNFDGAAETVRLCMDRIGT